MMNRLFTRKKVFTEYDFLLLFSAITFSNEKALYINRFKLQEDLYKYYDNEEFNFLFEDISKKENADNKYLEIDSGFTYAIAYGLLLSFHDNTKDLIYIINLTEKSAKKTIDNYDEKLVSAMTKLVDLVYQRDDNERKAPQRTNIKQNES